MTILNIDIKDMYIINIYIFYIKNINIYYIKNYFAWSFLYKKYKYLKCKKSLRGVFFLVFYDIFDITVQNFAEISYSSGADILTISNARKQRRTYSKILLHSILCYSFFLHGLPKRIIYNAHSQRPLPRRIE